MAWRTKKATKPPMIVSMRSEAIVSMVSGAHRTDRAWELVLFGNENSDDYFITELSHMWTILTCQENVAHFHDEPGSLMIAAEMMIIAHS